MIEMHIISKDTEWACDVYRGYTGHSVHVEGWPEGMGFPAFDREQMEECARICEKLGERYSFDEFPHVEYHADGDFWAEVYGDDDIADVLYPVTVDGVELFFLGRYTDWVWGEIDDSRDYEEA